MASDSEDGWIRAFIGLLRQALRLEMGTPEGRLNYVGMLVAAALAVVLGVTSGADRVIQAVASIWSAKPHLESFSVEQILITFLAFLVFCLVYVVVVDRYKRGDSG